MDEQPAARKKGLINWLMTITSVGVLGVMVYFVFRQWDALVSFPWKLDFWPLILVFFYHSLSLAATYVVWHLMMRRLGGFTNWQLDLRYYYLSTLAKRLPTSLPYIGGRLAMYHRHGVSGAAVINAVFLENLLIGVGGVLVFLLFSPFFTQVPAGITLPLAAGGLGVLAFSIFKPEIYVQATNWVLRKFNRRTLDLVPGRLDMLTWIGIYMLPWLLSGASLFYAMRAVSSLSSVGYFDSLAVLTLATLASLVYFVVPGGLALKEMTGSMLLSAWLPVPVALTLMFIFRLMHTANEIIWAYLVMLIPDRN